MQTRKFFILFYPHQCVRVFLKLFFIAWYYPFELTRPAWRGATGWGDRAWERARGEDGSPSSFSNCSSLRKKIFILKPIDLVNSPLFLFSLLYFSSFPLFIFLFSPHISSFDANFTQFFKSSSFQTFLPDLSFPLSPLVTSWLLTNKRYKRNKVNNDN